MKRKANYSDYKYQQKQLNMNYYAINNSTIKNYFQQTNLRTSRGAKWYPNDTFQSILSMIKSKDAESWLLLKGILTGGAYRIAPFQLAVLCSNEYKSEMEALILFDFTANEFWSSYSTSSFK